MKSLYFHPAKPLIGFCSVLLSASLLGTASLAQAIGTETVSQVVERAGQLAQSSKYEEAQKLLKAQLAQDGVTSADQISLKNALADVDYQWAGYSRREEVADFAAAIGHYEAAYESDKVLRHAQAGRDLAQIGGTYYAQHNFDQAFKYWIATLEIIREVKDRPDEAHTLINIALVCRLMNRDIEAINYYNLALPIYRELKNQGREAAVLSNIALSYARMRRREEAVNSYKLALKDLPGPQRSSPRSDSAL